MGVEQKWGPAEGSNVVKKGERLPLWHQMRRFAQDISFFIPIPWKHKTNPDETDAMLGKLSPEAKKRYLESHPPLT